MKKAIWILSITLFISIGIIVLLIFSHQHRITNLTKSNDEIIKNKDALLDKRQQTIDYYIANPLTKETVKYLSSSEKDKKTIELQKAIEKISKSDGIIINDLYDRLNKTNETLKSTLRFQHSLSLFVMGGLSGSLQRLYPDIFIGLTYRRYFTNCKLIEPFIGVGIAYKVYEDRGGATLFEGGFKFGKKKL
jgi:hypothetical protein